VSAQSALLRNLGAVAAGASSMAMTVLLVHLVQRSLHFNLFGLLYWFIPFGAFLTGMSAASGYYVAAIKLNLKAETGSARILMALAAVTQAALYYADYLTTTTDDGTPATAIIGFRDFVALLLTNTKLSIGSSGNWSTTIGAAGYVVGVLQYIALIGGGAYVYHRLTLKPFCETCGKYLKPIKKVQFPFRGGPAELKSITALTTVDSTYFAELHKLPEGETSAVELELFACPACARQAVIERPMFPSNGSRNYGHGERTLWLPAGKSVAKRLANLTDLLTND
jgi:hypothetical protein